MDTTSFENLLKESEDIVLLEDGLRLSADSQWIVKNETRLSYTTIVRLVECCREYHWKKDVIPYIANLEIDSTCKIIKGEFFHPIEAKQKFDIVYGVKEFRKHSYVLLFLICDFKRTLRFAELELVMVFINIANSGYELLKPPELVVKSLEQLSKRGVPCI